MLLKISLHRYVKFSIFWFVIPILCLNNVYHQDLWAIYATENSFFEIFITHSLTNPMLCALALLWLLLLPLPLPLALLAPEPEEDSSLEDTEDISMVSICETMSSSRKGDLISSIARLGSSKSSSSLN